VKHVVWVVKHVVWVVKHGVWSRDYRRGQSPFIFFRVPAEFLDGILARVEYSPYIWHAKNEKGLVA
ncbi:MAG: hypothetical protein LBD64_05560, partial [Odoribacteraceae bacterium]|nr:hypothetical protein [Odoribacteraceae bacterium]